MPRSKNAQKAVELFLELVKCQGLNAQDCWKAIAQLLLTPEKWEQGTGWAPFKNVVVYRETNDFRSKATGAPGAVLQKAENLTAFLARELSVDRGEIDGHIGRYWKIPEIRKLQPHNLVGHAFRSIVVTALATFGDKKISYEEEVDARAVFPGHPFPTRSRQPKLDIIARRGESIVALLSVRWRFRHDRVDVVDEALAYVPAAKRQNKDVRFYAVLGEFSPTRLVKVLNECPPATQNGAITATVHFAPQLLWEGLKENGRSRELRSLEWLVNETYKWK